MNDAWVVVAVVGVATVIFKSSGPVLLGGRELPVRLRGVVAMLAPALLAALVVTQAVGGNRRLVFDARLLGLAGAAIAIRLRAPVLLVVVLAAALAAAARAL
ncbi:MAG TPA: AzlD domain-containing protein [Gaiellaceae bacterium]